MLPPRGPLQKRPGAGLRPSAQFHAGTALCRPIAASITPTRAEL